LTQHISTPKWSTILSRSFIIFRLIQGDFGQEKAEYYLRSYEEKKTKKIRSHKKESTKLA